jgi:hypothetical protein
MKTFNASDLAHKRTEIFEAAKADGAILQRKNTNGAVLDEFVMVCAQKIADIKADAIDDVLDNCAWHHNREFIKCDDIIKYAESLRNK